MRITQSIDLKKKDGFLFINAILLMGFFTFLFLGTEYLYVTVISHMVSDNSAVLAQNYALGVSAIGFLLYFLLGYFDRKRARAKDVLFILIGLIALFCIALISMEMAYAIVFTAGLVLFLLLGLLGSAAFSVSMKLMVMDRYLARAVGISYAVGIMLQFIHNNLIRSELAKAIFLAVFLVLLVCLMIKNDGICADRNREKTNNLEDIENSAGKNVRLGIVVGISLILLVALMTCVFSTLDNAVTLVHSSGVMDIGQWPRILLALSGISAGFVFDVKDRKYMGFVMCHAAVYDMHRSTQIFRSIFTWSGHLLPVGGIFCRIFHFGISGTFPTYEDTGTVGLYGAGGQQYCRCRHRKLCSDLAVF